MIVVDSTAYVHHFYFALSALGQFMDPNPGRCPGLLHFAPLALEGFTQSLPLPIVIGGALAFIVELATFAIEVDFVVKRLEADA